MSDSTSDRAAAEWVVRRDRGLTPAEEREYLEWKERQSGAMGRLRRVEGVWSAMDEACRDPSLVAEADALEVRLRQGGTTPGRRMFSACGLVAAAVVALMAFVGWLTLGRDPDPAYRILASTARVLTLPDGSVARLNGDAQVAVDYAGDGRRVTLLRGEAHFEVVKDPGRPFLVRAGEMVVRAVGTAFNVRLSGADVEVIVTEGRVRIEDASLWAEAASPAWGTSGPAFETCLASAGERVVVPTQPAPEERTAHVTSLVAHEVEQALAWQTTRLVFRETTLDQVVDAFNRHNARKLVLADEQLRERTLTGVFRADNLDGFVRLVQATVDVRAEVAASGTIRLHLSP